MRYWVTLVAVVSRLGAGRRMRLKMVVVGLVAPLRDKLVGPRDARLRIRYGRLEVPWRVGPSSDFDVLNEVLVLNVYAAVLPAKNPTMILDLGSHMGASVLFWRERFPGSRIVAVEPDPVTFRRLGRNVGGLPAVELRNLAVCHEDGPAKFVPARQAWVSSLSGVGKTVTVDGRSFRSLIAEIGEVDLLKVDIEGAERYILDDWALQRVRSIIGEYHDAGDAEGRELFFAGLRKHFELQVGDAASFIAFSGSRFGGPRPSHSAAR